MYSEHEYTVKPHDGNIEDHFAAAVENLPKNVYSIMKRPKADIEKVVIERDFNPLVTKEGNVYIDAKGNLKDWWTKQDGGEFEKRTQCILDQYGQYIIVDDIKINSKLTLGEDVADLGGQVLAWIAWKAANKGKTLQPVDGFTPDQRFFIGMAQWACGSDRPENLRLSALTNPHSPNEFRINGVVANMPQFQAAFSCKLGQPMVREKACKVW